MTSIVMFVLNDVVHDARVQREAATLRDAGYQVTIMGRPADPWSLTGGRLTVAGTPVILVPIPGRLRQLLGRFGRQAGRRSPPPRPAGDQGRTGGEAPVAGRLGRRSARAIRSLAAGIDWLVRWRLGAEAWCRAAAQAAPSAALWWAHDFDALPAALAGRRRHGGRVVYDSHEIFLEAGGNATRPAWARSRLARLERRLTARIDALVTVNDALAEVLAARLPAPRVVVAHNCPPRWTGSHGTGSLRAACGIGPDVPLILYHGALAPHRGIEELAAALLLPALSDAHLALMGEGPMRSRLASEASDPRYGGRLHLLDAVTPDVLVDWVSDADVGAMPIQPSTLNHRLSTPNKLFECLAAGVPCIVSDFPGMRAIVLDPGVGPLGAACDPADPGSIAAACRWILDLPPDARAELRARCRRAAATRWNWEVESRGLVELAAQLTGQAGG